MIHDVPQAEPRDGEAVTLGTILRDLVRRAIERETDPTEQKARIMITRQHGHISDQEAADWIALLELAHA